MQYQLCQPLPVLWMYQGIQYTTQSAFLEDGSCLPDIERSGGEQFLREEGHMLRRHVVKVGGQFDNFTWCFSRRADRFQQRDIDDICSIRVVALQLLQKRLLVRCAIVALQRCFSRVHLARLGQLWLVIDVTVVLHCAVVGVYFLDSAEKIITVFH